MDPRGGKSSGPETARRCGRPDRRVIGRRVGITSRSGGCPHANRGAEPIGIHTRAGSIGRGRSRRRVCPGGDELGMTEGAIGVPARLIRAAQRADPRGDRIALTVADPSQIDDEIRDLSYALGS
jgi:hypothetical protein